MAIKLNGVGITSNKLNGSDVSEEKLNGVKVWPTATTKKWVYLYYETSEPPYQYYAYADSYIEEVWVYELERKFPARDLAVGTMGYVYVPGGTDYYILQVQEV